MKKQRVSGMISMFLIVGMLASYYTKNELILIICAVLCTVCTIVEFYGLAKRNSRKEDNR